MKVTSKVFYREIRTALHPQMQAAGYALASSSLGWTKPLSGGFLGVWFQCDKWGWDLDWGSRFTVEFQLAPEPIQGVVGAKRTRIGHLLEGYEELDSLRLLSNDVIERLPGTVARRLETMALPEGGEVVLRGHRTDPEPAFYGRDIWLNYHSVDDTKMWASYFQEHLSRFLLIFENGERSAAGEANSRFHAMMARAQSATNRSEKRRIIEEFSNSEADSHYSAAARKWLEPL